jgi:hypothetical protein
MARTKDGKMGGLFRYTDANVLKAKVDAYFVFADSKKQPYTINSLVEFLDIEPAIFNSYKKQAKFKRILTMANLRCLAWAERSLLSGKNATGTIFLMKNHFEWKDKSLVDANLNGNFSLSKLFDAAKDKKDLEIPVTSDPKAVTL